MAPSVAVTARGLKSVLVVVVGGGFGVELEDPVGEGGDGGEGEWSICTA